MTEDQADHGAQAAVRLIDELLGLLTTPLSGEEREAGWSEQIQSNERQLIAELRDAVVSGRGPERGEETNLLRWLDVYGIERGRIADLYSKVQQALKERYRPGT